GRAPRREYERKGASPSASGAASGRVLHGGVRQGGRGDLLGELGHEDRVGFHGVERGDGARGVAPPPVASCPGGTIGHLAPARWRIDNRPPGRCRCAEGCCIIVSGEGVLRALLRRPGPGGGSRPGPLRSRHYARYRRLYLYTSQGTLPANDRSPGRSGWLPLRYGFSSPTQRAVGAPPATRGPHGPGRVAPG